MKIKKRTNKKIVLEFKKNEDIQEALFWHDLSLEVIEGHIYLLDQRAGKLFYPLDDDRVLPALIKEGGVFGFEREWEKKIEKELLTIIGY